MKKAWKSKTLWINFLLAAAALFAPAFLPFLEGETGGVVLATVINIVLRFVTKEPIEILPKK